MKHRICPAGYLLVFLIFTLALAGCKEAAKEKAGPNRAVQTVEVLTIKTEKATSYMEIMGTVQAADNAVISSRISGHIIELPVVLGSKVNKGDLLVKINAAEISAQLLQAKAQLAQADRNLGREKNLLKKGASTPETVRTLEDTHRIAAAAVKEVQTMLDYATITAPFSGIITRKSANIGDLAAPGKPLLDIENETNLQVVANIPETMILKIHVGDGLPVSIPSAGFASTGKVQEVSPAADPSSHTAPIKLSLPSSPNLRSGQFARLSLPERTVDAIIIPQAAVLPFGQMERVFTVTNGKARLRLVRTGATEKGRVEILAGLDPGEQVVVGGNKDLTDGQPVTLSH
jgi:membrane fusion protein, multidrug efflux system